MRQTTEAGIISRAQGCLLGQLSGDALGSLVEFQTPAQILARYPQGVRQLEDGGTWNTLAGQPTDDSEMALVLSRLLARQGRYDPESARKEYVFWLNSCPFDRGTTVSAGLQGSPNPNSQANGALMRISPLGIFGVQHDFKDVARWARSDAALTHPHPVCQEANALFAMAISYAIRKGTTRTEVFERIVAWAEESQITPSLRNAINQARTAPPVDYVHQQGWVLIAFQNALWQLLHAPNLVEGVVDTVMRGGDTDTNAAIAGALLGAAHGRSAIPAQWLDRLQNCRPQKGLPNVHRPRPECFWPIDALELAESLVSLTGISAGIQS